MQNPRLYATFLLWLLSELFEQLPEVGDPDKPKLVFFFDEAHLLFTDAPKALLDKIEQVVRLIRSKGVGVYFVTQNPLDVPDKVLAQLGNRVQHALRAFTPRDQKAVKAAAETFRANPKLNTAQVIMELGKGEALVSFLEGNGTPVDGRARHDPPAFGAHRADYAGGAQGGDGQVAGQGQIRYGARPNSAFEILQKRAQVATAAAGRSRPEQCAGPGCRPDGVGSTGRRHCRRDLRHQRQARPTALDRTAMARDVTRTVSNRVAGQIAADIGKSLAGSTGSSVGRAIVRGALGGILRR